MSSYLHENSISGIPALAGIDTRHLTQLIREHGVMRSEICFEGTVNSIENLECSLVSQVSSLVNGRMITGVDK